MIWMNVMQDQVAFLQSSVSTSTNATCIYDVHCRYFMIYLRRHNTCLLPLFLLLCEHNGAHRNSRPMKFEFDYDMTFIDATQKLCRLCIVRQMFVDNEVKKKTDKAMASLYS